MVLDRKSKIPLHLQAQEMLRKLIEKQEYRDGKLLPNEVDLAEQLHISTSWSSKGCWSGKRAWVPKWP